MEHNKDKRVIRTKALLIRSLSALMKQKNIKDITVNVTKIYLTAQQI